MTPEQIDVFAEGLYHLAVCDGVDDTEVRFIREFLAEAGADPARIDNLGKRAFDADELEWHLNTQHLRRVFIKACYLLVKADGKVTPSPCPARSVALQAWLQPSPSRAAVSSRCTSSGSA
jgi:hypothetical protein